MLKSLNNQNRGILIINTILMSSYFDEDPLQLDSFLNQTSQSDVLFENSFLPTFIQEPESSCWTLSDHQSRNQPSIERELHKSVAQVNDDLVRKQRTKKGKRPRKTLTKELIASLNQRLYEFQQRPKEKQISLVSIAQQLQIGYSTVLRKHREFKAQSFIKEEKLPNHQQISQKCRLARCLILNFLKSSTYYRSSKQISTFILNNYGIYYDVKMINRQLRKIGFKQTRYYSEVPQNNDILKMMIESPFQALLTIKNAFFIYLGKYVLKLNNEQEIKIVLLANRVRSSITVIEDDMNEAHEIMQYLKALLQKPGISQYTYSFVVTSKQDLPLESSQEQKGSKFKDILQKINLKLFLISQSQQKKSPVNHLYRQIASRIQTLEISRSVITSILPQWLTTQQESASSIISSIQSTLCKPCSQ